MKVSNLTAIGFVLLLFLGVYVPSFFVVILLKPKPAAAVPLVIGISFALALF